MNKPLIVIVGAIIILILLLIWVYLLFFGTPKTAEDLFSNFNLGGQTENIPDQNINATNTEPVLTNVRDKKLRQLTTKPVAGFGEINEFQTPTLPTLYYVEMGTGHIFSINLETSEETRVSGTTVVGANLAEVSSNGDYVVMMSKNNTKSAPLVVGKISTTTSELEIEDFSNPADQFNLSKDGTELMYSSREPEGLVGHVYNFTNQTKKVLFKLPFHETFIQWGEKSNMPHYFNPKPSYALEGYLYQALNEKTSRLPVEGFGLSSLATKDIVAYSAFSMTGTKNYLYDRNLHTNEQIPIRILPEKCVLNSSTSLICAYDGQTSLPAEFPDAWYQGKVSFKDSLFLIDGPNKEDLKLLVNTFTETGRELDITNLKLGISGRVLYFINKNDNTLWMYEL